MSTGHPKPPPEIHSIEELVFQIRNNVGSDHFVSTTLQTDERVIARVTDGIYRQPGSALRELISNAYDADATRVVINTDAPRFDRIVIEDNGHGMSPEVLAHLVFHIGGSAKRSENGRTLGITDANDSSRSPGGRRLIGKIGIGLFSVSQLTHSFQIITKVKGDAFRTIATVILKQYQDEDIASEAGGNHKFESGKVNIWREKAADIASHGTSVVLTSIKPEAKNTLRSRKFWDAIEQEESSVDSKESTSLDPPKYHIGRVDKSNQLLKQSGKNYNSLPWDRSDAPSEAFRKMVQAVWDEVYLSSPNPKLDGIFDYYLTMVWQLALAAPLPYVEGHLFDKDIGDWAEAYELSNSPKGSARKLDLKGSEPIRKALNLQDPRNSSGPFDVFLDDLQLFRPIKFTNLPATSNALKQPLVFLGKCKENFPKVPRELSGGPLAFEAYLFWAPKIAPTEHQGSLIRIHGSSGTLFDPTFLRYQVAELTRLRQITCEIFVSEGLDSALNIDRESFNTAHPHSVYITKWLHRALRQLTTAQKKLASEARDQSRSESKDSAVSAIQRIATDVWVQETDDVASKPPQIDFTDREKQVRTSGDSYVFARSVITSELAKPKGKSQLDHAQVIEEKLRAITQVMASFGLLDYLPKRRQEKLLKAIYKILEAPEA